MPLSICSDRCLEPRKPFSRSALLCCVLALLSISMARAERADRDRPLNLEADHATYDDLKQVYTLTGNVVLTKGTMVLKATSATVTIDPEGYQHAVALAKAGDRAMLRQKRDDLNEYIEGYGERIEYDGRTETARLIKRAQLKRLEGAKVADQIHGDLITYDSRTETYTAASGQAGTDGRVRAVIAPRKSAAQNGAQQSGVPNSPPQSSSSIAPQPATPAAPTGSR